jgi:hypothetical protein
MESIYLDSFTLDGLMTLREDAKTIPYGSKITPALLGAVIRGAGAAVQGFVGSVGFGYFLLLLGRASVNFRNKLHLMLFVSINGG